MLPDSNGASLAKLQSDETLPKKGAVCVQWKRCGRPSCRCARGELHGPYYCLFWRSRGRLHKRYVRLSEAPAVQATCREHRERARAARQEARQARAELRALIAELRGVERLWRI
jgi:hypothetical protein